MGKLGTWSLSGTIALLLAVGLSGTASAQERGVPWLGVVTQELDDDLRDGLEYRGEGVLVTRVAPDSPAERAGIERRDILVSINQRSVDSPEELTRMVRDMRVGQDVSVVVIRDGRRRTIRARLAERDDLPAPRPRMGRETEEPPIPPRTEERELLPRDQDPEGDADILIRGLGRGRLGIRVDDGGEDSDSGRRGARIVDVVDDSPAERAGLREGDIVVRVGDERIESSDDLVRTIRDLPAGSVTITVLRDGEERRVEAELERTTERRMLRIGPGRARMLPMPGDRRMVRPPMPDRDDQALRNELRELREELRQLREKLERLEEERDR